MQQGGHFLETENMKRILPIVAALMLLVMVGCSSNAIRGAGYVTSAIPPAIEMAKPLVHKIDPENSVKNLAALDALSDAAKAAGPILERLATKLEEEENK